MNKLEYCHMDTGTFIADSSERKARFGLRMLGGAWVLTYYEPYYWGGSKWVKSEYIYHMCVGSEDSAFVVEWHGQLFHCESGDAIINDRDHSDNLEILGSHWTWLNMHAVTIEPSLVAHGKLVWRLLSKEKYDKKMEVA